MTMSNPNAQGTVFPVFGYGGGISLYGPVDLF